jgi:transposase
MTPWLVHELRNLGLEVICLDARHARAALEMRINKTDQNDAEGLAQIVRTRWVPICPCQIVRQAPRACSSWRKDATQRYDDTIVESHQRSAQNVWTSAQRDERIAFDRKVEALLLGRSDVALIVRPMLVARRKLREQIAAFDKAIRILVRPNPACRLLMSVPGIGVLSSLAYVSMVASSLEDWARAIAKRSGNGKARVALARKFSVILHRRHAEG